MAGPAAGSRAVSRDGRELAGCGCEPCSHGFGWGLVAQNGAGAVVELAGDLVEVAGGVDGQVGALGKYWRSRPLVFSLVPRW